jgi:lambda repressor-like predicted transcriptional regulator
MTNQARIFLVKGICLVLLALVMVLPVQAKDKSDDPISIVADVIGIDAEVMWEAVKSGQTIADVAVANGVSPQTVIDALLTEKQAVIDAMAADGRITAEKAAEMMAEAETSVAAYVNSPIESDKGGKGKDKNSKGKYSFPPAVIELLGVEEDVLWEAVKNGQTIADVADANGVDPQTVIDALLAEAEQKLVKFVTEPIKFDKSGKGKYSFPSVIFELLGVEKDVLWGAVKNGQTIADVAIDNGVDPISIFDALMTEAQSDINAAVESGKITAEEASEWLAKAETAMDKLVYEPIGFDKFRTYLKEDSEDKELMDVKPSDKEGYDKPVTDKVWEDKPSTGKEGYVKPSTGKVWSGSPKLTK